MGRESHLRPEHCGCFESAGCDDEGEEQAFQGETLAAFCAKIEVM